MTATFIEEYKNFLLFQKDNGGEFSHFYIAREKNYSNDVDGGSVVANGATIEEVKESIDKYLRSKDYEREKAKEDRDSKRKSLISSLQTEFKGNFHDKAPKTIAAVEVSDNEITCNVWTDTISFEFIQYLKDKISRNFKGYGLKAPIDDVTIGSNESFKPDTSYNPSFNDASRAYYGEERDNFKRLYDNSKPLLICFKTY